MDVVRKNDAELNHVKIQRTNNQAIKKTRSNALHARQE